MSNYRDEREGIRTTLDDHTEAIGVAEERIHALCMSDAKSSVPIEGHHEWLQAHEKRILDLTVSDAKTKTEIKSMINRYAKVIAIVNGAIASILTGVAIWLITRGS